MKNRSAFFSAWLLLVAVPSLCHAEKATSKPKTAPARAINDLMDRPADTELYTDEKKSGKPIIRNEDNFSLLHPGAKWRAIEAKRLHPLGSLAFEREDKKMFCVVVPLLLGQTGRIDPAIDDLGNMIEASFSNAGFQDFLKRGMTLVDGQAFGKMSLTLRPTFVGIPLRHEIMHKVSHNFGWGIDVWGTPENAAEIESEALRIAKGFQIIDENKKTKTQSLSPLTDQDKPQLGYKTNLRDTAWGRWIKGGTINNLVDFSSEREGGGLLVMPVRLADEEMPTELDAIAHALLIPLGFDYPDGGIYQTRPWGKDGIEIESTRTQMDGHVTTWLMRVAKHRAVVHLVAGYVVRDPQVMDMSTLRDAMDAVTLSEPNNRHASPELTGLQIKDRALFLNQVGLHYFNNERWAEAFRYCMLAFKQRQDSPTFLSNAVTALERQGRFKEAHETLKANAPKFQTDKAMQAHFLLLAATQGEVEKSAPEFIKLINDGYDDQRTVDLFVSNAVRFNKTKVAVNVADAQVKKHPTIVAKMTHASAVIASGDNTKGLALLEKAAREHPTSDSAALQLAEYYNEFGKFGKAADIAMNMVNTGRDSARARVIYAVSCARRTLYREAKQSLEVAQQLAPNDAGVKNLLLQVSSILGEGVSSETQRVIQPVPVPTAVAEILANAPKLDQLDPEDRPGVIELRSDGYFFKKGQKQRHTIRRRMKLLTKEGVDMMSSLQFSYDPLFQHIYVNFLEVTDPDGKIIPQKSNDASYVRDADTGESASQVKTLTVPVSGMRPGSTLEYSITYEDKPVDEDHQHFYFERHAFGTSWPVGADVIFVTGDVEEVKGITGRNSNVKTLTSADTLAWYLIQPPVAKEIPEPYQAPVEDYAPIVWLGDANSTSWKAVAQEYLDLVKDRLKPDTTISALAKRLTTDIPEPRAKLKELTSYAQKEINYKAIEFGLRARRPNSAMETLNHRYGDCKDHALLLHHLLAGVGIESYLTLLNTHSRTKEEMPSLDQFNHMILYVPSLGPSGYVDITGKYGDATALPGPYFTTQMLVLDPDNPRLMLPPVPPEDSDRIETHRTISINEKGDAHVEENVVFHGYAAEAWHASFATVTQNNQLRFMQSHLDRQVPVQLESYEFTNLPAVSEPARMKMSYTLRKTVHEDAGGKRSMAMPAVWEKAQLPVDYVKSRKTPFRTFMPTTFESDVTFVCPKALDPDSVKAFERAIDGPYGSWEMKPTLSADGKELKLAFRSKAKPGSFPAEEYEAFHDAWDAAVRIWDTQVRWSE
jgi:tetratricopeptide (TPR) repeat protein